MKQPKELIRDMLFRTSHSKEHWALAHYAAWQGIPDGTQRNGLRRVHREQAIRQAITGWANLGVTHALMYDSPIGDDGVLGEAFADMGRALRTMLNGETGRFDCGTLDSLILDIAQSCGVDLDGSDVAEAQKFASA